MSTRLHSPKFVKLPESRGGMHVWVCSRCEATSCTRDSLQAMAKADPCPGGAPKTHPEPWGNLGAVA